MVEFLTGVGPVIFENADVLEAAVPLQILDTESRQAQELLDLVVIGIPQMPFVARFFEQYFVRSHRTHAVIQPVAAPRRLALDAIERMGMKDRARRPGAAL